MKTKNLTPFICGAKVTSRRPPQPEMVLVVRGTFTLASGKVLEVPEGPKLVAQGPMRAELFHESDDERAGECLYPGDFADAKRHAEVMARGTCHVPFGQALSECPVRFAVGDWSKTLRVVGPRFWSDTHSGAVMSAALPFTTMPLDYAHAYGGPGYGANPVGKGFDGRELPNVESPRAAVRSNRDRPVPGGFGPLSPAWSPRAGKIGRAYGERWRSERAPYYAEDFDWTYFQAAPEDQWLPEFLVGDEALLFQNMHPTEQLLSARLPGMRVRAFINDRARRFREVGLKLDTLFADVDAGRVYLTWRGVEPVQTDDLTDVETLLVASEALSMEPLPEARYRAILEKFEADPLELSERVSPESLEKLDQLGKPPIPPAAPDSKSDPFTAVFEKMLAPMPVEGKKERLGTLREAMGRMTAKASGHADFPGLLAKAVNDVVSAPPPAMPSRPGAPMPSWVGDAGRRARESLARTKKTAAEKNAPLTGTENLDAFLSSPMFASAEPADRAPPGPGRDMTGRDFGGQDLRGCDLRAAVLVDANFAKANLRGANLRGANLTGAVLKEADLTEADLTGAVLTKANLNKSRCVSAVFRDATLDGAFFEKADLTDATLAGARGEGTLFPEANLTRANAEGIGLSRAFARGAILERASLARAQLSRCLFLDVKARGLDLTRASLNKSTFSGADLQEAKLVEARGERTIWLKASLSRADFTRAVLPHAHFLEALGDNTVFRRADLRELRGRGGRFDHAEFVQANLFGADFSKCSLNGTQFRESNLYDAKFVQAAGVGCNFTGANLNLTLGRP